MEYNCRLKPGCVYWYMTSNKKQAHTAEKSCSLYTVNQSFIHSFMSYLMRFYNIVWLAAKKRDIFNSALAWTFLSRYFFVFAYKWNMNNLYWKVWHVVIKKWYSFFFIKCCQDSVANSKLLHAFNLINLHNYVWTCQSICLTAMITIITESTRKSNHCRFLSRGLATVITDNGVSTCILK